GTGVHLWPPQGRNLKGKLKVHSSSEGRTQNRDGLPGAVRVCQVRAEGPQLPRLHPRGNLLRSS
ncbi:hypothetical protein NPIL_501501, partial [Nephila pilipes]